MPRKEKSITTLSQFNTDKVSSPRRGRSTIAMGLSTPVQFVKGVGPRLGSVFESRGIRTVKDLLYFFPRTYEDRSLLSRIDELQEGQTATLRLRVVSQKRIPIRRMGKSILEVRCENESGAMRLKWFHTPRGLDQKLHSGSEFVASGKIKIYQSVPEMIHPEITWGAQSEVTEKKNSNEKNFGGLIPIYSEIDGVPTRSLRNVLWNALEQFSGSIRDEVPEYLLEKWGLISLKEAVRNLHFPGKDVGLELMTKSESDAHLRVIYDELFRFEFLILKRRLEARQFYSSAFDAVNADQEVLDAQSRLPFELTGGQKEALEKVNSDLKQTHPMNRLIQGDVGSGKTVVAFLAAKRILASGSQVAFLAPTEILAEQHKKTATKLFGDFVPTLLLTGKTSTSERKKIQERLSQGEPLVLVGTHALLEEWVAFQRLDLVIIDEQHRFGVEQRKVLREKGMRPQADGSRIYPHNLILSATPIPRTLALTAFGDLSVSSIRERPPGRMPVLTKVIRDKEDRLRVYETIRKEVSQGRQAYMIFPLVNDSEAEGFTQLKSAVAEADRLGKEVFPEMKLGLLHGKLSSDEKVDLMKQFEKNEIQVLISTTVVEVGVDVPNATVMVIEHAERFGLSQLHQLRGRVGRGKDSAFCFLMAPKQSEATTAHRLEVLEKTQDGFKIAEADLEIRGPGEFIGTRQSGALAFKVANLVRDAEWLQRAREDVIEILKSDSNLKERKHASLKAYSENEGKNEAALLGTF